MSNRLEMLEAVLDLMDEGVAALDEQGHVIFWNTAAASLTGYRTGEVLSRPCPDGLYRIDEDHARHADEAASARRAGSEDASIARSCAMIAGHSQEPARAVPPSPPWDRLLERPTLVSIRHQRGHTLPAMLRKLALRDVLGRRMGSVLLFYPVEEMDTLPHGERGENAAVERSQAAMEDRLEAARHQWLSHRVPFGLVWLRVDQAATLRRTHGRDACESMLRIMEQTLLRALAPGEVIGRWGTDEFLVLSHERTESLLVDRAERISSAAGTADFQWWGDRVSLSVSFGASQVSKQDSLHTLLSRAKAAAGEGRQAGTNQVHVGGEKTCSQ